MEGERAEGEKVEGERVEGKRVDGDKKGRACSLPQIKDGKQTSVEGSHYLCTKPCVGRCILWYKHNI